MGGELVDHVLGAHDVVRLVDQQGDAGTVSLGEVDLALHLGVQEPEQEVHARLAVLLADRAHVRVDQQDVAGVDDLPERDVGRVAEPAAQRRDLQQQADLVPWRVEALRGGAAGELEFVGELVGEELGGLVQVGLVRAGLGDGRADVRFGWQQEVVDVLELGAAILPVGERDRADTAW